MTPFARLGLLACATVWAASIVGVARYFGWLTAGLVSAIALLLALLVTLELASGSAPPGEVEKPDELSNESAAQASADFVMRRRDRREIDESARRADEQ